jgi:hypothetical protein
MKQTTKPKKTRKKAPKTIKPNIKKKRPSKIIPLWDEYRDLNSFKMKPMSETGLETLADHLLKWAEHTESFAVRKFFRERGICLKTMERWCERSEKLNTAVQAAGQAIGDRLYEGGLKRTYETSLVRQGLCRYDNEWQKLEEWKSKLKEEKKQEATTVIVKMVDHGEKNEEEK